MKYTKTFVFINIIIILNCVIHFSVSSLYIGVGKTSLVVRNMGGVFSENVNPTIGASFFSFHMYVHFCVYVCACMRVSVCGMCVCVCERVSI